MFPRHTGIGTFRRRSRRFSPKGAGFDSPGRISPGLDDLKDKKAPTGRDSRVSTIGLRPVGISPLQGLARNLARYPGLKRPGLSNLAPFGAAVANSRNNPGCVSTIHA